MSDMPEMLQHGETRAQCNLRGLTPLILHLSCMITLLVFVHLFDPMSKIDLLLFLALSTSLLSLSSYYVVIQLPLSLKRRTFHYTKNGIRVTSGQRVLLEASWGDVVSSGTTGMNLRFRQGGRYSLFYTVREHLEYDILNRLSGGVLEKKRKKKFLCFWATREDYEESLRRKKTDRTPET